MQFTTDVMSHDTSHLYQGTLERHNADRNISVRTSNICVFAGRNDNAMCGLFTIVTAAGTRHAAQLIVAISEVRHC